LDLTAYLQQQQAANKTTVSIALKGVIYTSAIVAFNSREAGATGPSLLLRTATA